MNEIEELLKEVKIFVTPDDYEESDRAVCYEFSPEQLKHLIELVEDEQHNITKHFEPRPIRDAAEGIILETPKVSQIIDWEEL